VFEQWSVTDIQDLVRRDRNHPCVILWSIGNEIDYANDPFTDPVLGADYQPGNPPAQNLVKRARPLLAAVKSLDRTRPVTAALANLPMSEAVGLPELLDAVGYNYQEARYADDHKKFPGRIIFGSENSQQYNAWTAVRDNNYVAGKVSGAANRWSIFVSPAETGERAGVVLAAWNIGTGRRTPRSPSFATRIAPKSP
jgi:beta-galactosidase